MILLDAIFINNSGGKILLDQLVENISQTSNDVYYLLDDRIRGSYPNLPANNVQYLKASLIERHKFYKKNKTKFKVIFCFGNLPPQVRTNSVVYTYFHNVLYGINNNQSSLLMRLTWLVKRLIFKSLSSNSNYWLVQSEQVRILLIKTWKIDRSKILVMPFYPKLETPKIEIPFQNESFLFISDGNSHKNHRNLLLAFEMLQADFSNAKLNLTISNNYPDLINEMDKLKRKGINVHNYGLVPRSELLAYYKANSCLIYPSLKESYGLALIEASLAKIPILASNLPYVFEVANPVDTFDPNNIESIYHCMKRFLLNQQKSNNFIPKNRLSEIIKVLVDANDQEVEVAF